MSPDDYQKVKEIFQSVLDLNEEERRTFLDERRSGHPAIVLEVERLLESYQPSYLERPAVANLIDHARGTLTSGQEIGQFTIVEKIGSGGMGEVYLAEDRKLGRQVAVKLLPDLFTNDDERLRRFQQEARTASALNHPNILTIYDFGESGNRHYIATEFIDGETLRERLHRGRQSITDSLDIAIQTASALAAAHEAGIIHRDIKPENIMLRRDGLVKVLDFGLAKLDDTKDRSVSPEAPTEHYIRTIPGVIMGTVQYMSPEQTRGQATDARTDIWSLGCVIYEMLTGDAPFRGDSTADQIAEIVKSHPAPLASVAPDIPPRVDEIVARTIQKNPDERYQTVTDLLVDLKRLNRDLDIESELLRSNPNELKAVKSKRNGNLTNGHNAPAKTSSVEYLVVGMKLHKRTAIGIVAGLLALVGCTAYIARNYWRNSNDTRFAYAEKIKLAAQALETSNLTYVRQLLDETKPKAGEEDLRGFEWHYLSQLHAERSAFQPIKLQHQGMVDAAAFSPDGNYVATAGFDNTVHVWDAATGNEIKTFTGHTGLIASVVFSADGTKLLTGSFDKTARLWDIESGGEIVTVQAQGPISSLFFVENGKRFAGLTDSIKVWDATTGAEVIGQTKPPGVGYPFAASSNGELFAAQDADKRAVVWEATTGRVIRRVETKSGSLSDLKFSHDSNLLLGGLTDGTAKLWDLKTGREIRTFAKHTGTIRDVVFSQDGKTIATGSEDSTIKVWDVERGFEITTLIGHANGVIALAFSPDNLKLASGSFDNTALIWNVPKSEGRGVLRGHSAAVEDVVFSHDGRLLASAGDDKTAKIWEVPTERERLTLSGQAAAVTAAVFSPNDKVVATGAGDGKVILWDTVTGKKNRTIDSTAAVAKVIFSPNGDLIATGHHFSDRDVKIWDSATGSARCSFSVGSAGAWDIQFSNDGKRITASAGENAVRLWDSGSCTQTRSFNGGADDKYAAAFRNDGKLIAMLILNNDRSLALIEAETGRRIASILGHNAELNWATLSPDGKRLVTSAGDSLLKIWDTATGQDLLSIKLGSVANKTAFSPNGKILAAGLQDGTVRLWRADGN